jgi:hypothetical protein
VCTTFLGIELKRTVTSGAKPVHFDPVLSQPLAFPPSVTQLPEKKPIGMGPKKAMRQAVAVFRAAVIGLLSQGLIQACRYETYVAGWRAEFKHVESTYMFSASENIDLNSVCGNVEGKIITVLTSWPKGKEALEGPDGAPIYELIRAIYGQDKDYPRRWAIDLATDDVVAQGWGQHTVWSRKRFELDAHDANRLRSDRAIVNELSSQLAQYQPDFSRALDDQIEKAIRSRKERHGPG